MNSGVNSFLSFAPGEKSNVSHVHIYVYIYMYIYIHAHVYGYGETEKGRLLARFELIAMVSWTLIAVD